MASVPATTNGTEVQGSGENGNGKRNISREFRQTVTAISTSLLTDWVGPERAKQAAGRIAAALAASAASARNPKEFYDCTPQSVATCIAVSALTNLMPGVGSTALAYVIPQRARKGERPMLQYFLSHRGLNALARRCGQTMVVTPISNTDEIAVDHDGDVRVVQRDMDNPPTTHEELRGVIVSVKEIGTGAVLARCWVPKKLIEQRREMSRSWKGNGKQYSPWSTWPVEMAMKTAMHYAISRGWCVIDDTNAARALSADVEADLAEPAGLLEPPKGSRSDQVADLLEGEVVAADDAYAEAEASVDVDADGEPEGGCDPAGDGSIDELVESMLRRIADAADSDELQAINDEVSVMNQQSHLPTKDVTTLKKAIKSRREEIAEKPEGALL